MTKQEATIKLLEHDCPGSHAFTVAALLSAKPGFLYSVAALCGRQDWSIHQTLEPASPGQEAHLRLEYINETVTRWANWATEQAQLVMDAEKAGGTPPAPHPFP